MKNEKGITLAILIITIIVMLILASVTIVTLGDGNLIGRTDESAYQYELSNFREILEEYHSMRQLKAREEDYNPKDLYATYDKNFGNNGVEGGIETPEETPEEKTKESIYTILKGLEGSRLDGKIYIVEGEIVEEWEYNNLKIIAKVNDEQKVNVTISAKLEGGYKLQYKTSQGIGDWLDTPTTENGITSQTVTFSRNDIKEAGTAGITICAQTVNDEGIGSEEKLTLTIPSIPINIEFKSSNDYIIATATGATDSINGIKGYKYIISTDGGVNWEKWSNVTLNGYKFSETPSTDIKIKAVAVNTLGLESDEYEKSLLYENIDGEITFTQSPEGWTNTDVNVTVQLQYSKAELPSNYTLQYKIENGNWIDVAPGTLGTNATITVKENTKVYARLYNKNLNYGTLNTEHTVTNIDKVLPTIELSTSDESYNSFKLSAKVNDSDSGLSKIIWYYKLEGESNYTSVETEYTPINSKDKGEIGVITKTQDITDLVYGGTYQVYAEVYDVAGNKSTSKDSTQEDIKITTPSYTITYDANGGEGAPEQQSKAHGVDLVLSNTVPTRTGYTFQGWATTNTSTTSEYPAGGTYKANGNATLYAVWSINQYELDLNVFVDGTKYENGYNERILANLFVGENSIGNVEDYCEEHNYGESWKIDGIIIDGQTIPYTASGTVGAEKTDINIYFNTVTFTPSDTRFGTLSAEEMLVLNGTAYTISDTTFSLSDGSGRTVTATANTVIGYWTEFTGWSLSDGTITEKTAVTANFSGTIKTVEVTFMRNHDENDTTSTIQTFTYIDDKGRSVEIEEPTQSFGDIDWTKTGYTLLGWAQTQDATEIEYEVNAIIDNSWIDSNAPSITLYAVWSINQYPINLNIYVDGINYEGDEGYSGRVLANLSVGESQYGYVADHYEEYNYGETWNIDGILIDDQVVPYTATGTVGTEENNIDIYFNTVTFVSSNTAYGSVTESEMIALNGTAYTINDATFNFADGRTVTAIANTVIGYWTEFTGWSVSDGTITEKTEVTANFTGTAKTVTVTFDSNDGSGRTDTQVFTYGVSGQSFSEKGWTREGYTLSNWNFESDGSGNSHSLIASVANSWIEANAPAVTLYAVWTAKPIQIYYNTNGGAVANTDGSRFTTQDSDGWVLDNNNSNVFYNRVTPDTQIDLPNYNNKGFLYIEKTGYTAVDRAEWKTSDGNTTFNHIGDIDYNTLKAVATDEGTYYRLDLYVNWNVNTVTLYYYPNADESEITRGAYSTEAEYISEGEYAGAYKMQTINYTDTDAANKNIWDCTSLFTRTGYHIENDETAWIKDSPDSGEYVSQASTDFKSLMENGSVVIKLYANWQVNKLTIYYYPNGGEAGGSKSGSDSLITEGEYAGANTLTQTIKYSDSDAANKNIYNCTSLFTRTGYYIENNATAWIKDSPSSGEYVNQANYDFSSLIANNTGVVIKLYANWKIKPIRVYYNTNGGTITVSNSKVYGQNSDGWILKDSNNFYYSTDSNNLSNYNNKECIYVERTGYTVVSEAEWKTSDGSVIFSQAAGKVDYDTLKKYATEEGTYYELELYVNWIENTLTIYYYPNATDVTRNTTNCTEAEYISTGDYAGAYKTQTVKYTEAENKNIWNCTGLFARTGYHIENDATAWIKDSPDSVEYVDQQSYDFSTLIANQTGVAIKLYANWQVNTATLYFYPNGGTSANETKYPITDGRSKATNTFTYETTNWNIYDVKTLFTKTGYSVPSDAQAWRVGSATATTYADQTGYNIKTQLASKTGIEIKLYANWQANTYNLTIDPNGGTITTFDNKGTYTSNKWTSTYTYDKEYKGKQRHMFAETMVPGNTPSYSNYIMPKTTNDADEGYIPYRPGYTFNGWEIVDENGKIVSDRGTITYNSWTSNSKKYWTYYYNYSKTYAGDITIQAQWTAGNYSIKYDANGGSGAPTAQTKATDVNLTLSSTVPTRTGYKFQGWATSSSATTATYSAGGSYTANKSATLYAVWKGNTYTVNYYNGTTKLGSSSHTYGTEENLTTISTLGGTQSGYTFTGWATSKTATSSKYTNGQSVTNLTTTAGGTVNLYAVWKRTVTFQHGGAGKDKTSATQYYNPAGPKYSVTTPSTITAISDWNTLGWRDDESADKAQWKAGEVSDSSANIFYAVYNRDATFHSGTKGVTTETTKIYYSARAGVYSITTLKPASISGWTSLGWRTDETATTADYKSGTKYTNDNGIGNKSLDFYAVYSRTITFYSGIAKATTKAVTQYYNSTSSKGVFSVTSPTPSAISGWTTLGWRTNTTAATKSYNSGATITASNSIYYAVYSRTVRLAYNANGGSGTAIANSTATQYYNTNGAITTPSFTLASNTYTKTGYTFSAWAAGSTSGTKYTAGETYTGFTPAVGTTSTTQTIYASWGANKYTVKYNGNGSTSGSTASSTHTYGVAKALTANGFKRAYTVTYNYNYTGSTSGSATATYNFAGWNKKADGSSTSYTNKQSVTNLTSSGSITLYAQWTGGNVTLPTPTRTGYTFGGWYKEAACTNKIGNGGATYAPTANTTLYAKWTAKTVKVTFMRNQSSTDTTSTTQTFTYDVANQSFNKTTWTKTGHKFAGWAETQSATTNKYTDGNSVSNNWINTNSPSKTLYAVWTANTYKITLDNQGATTPGSTAIYEKYGTGIYKVYKDGICENKMTTTANPITVPKKTGYTFGGYYTGTNGTGTQMINASGNITSDFTNTKYSANATLYAKWTANTYKITLNNQGATTAGSAAVYEKYGTGIYKEYKDGTWENKMTTTANPITVPKKTGYTFGGYYTGENGSGTQMINASGNITSDFTNTKYSSAATLNAKWTANTYKITLNNQGATTAGSTAIYEKYGTGIYKEYKDGTWENKMTTTANPITVPKKTSYTFGGYYTGQNGSGTQMINASGKITSSFTNTKYSSVATLYAKWTLKKHTLTINPNGGQISYDTENGRLLTTESLSTSFITEIGPQCFSTSVMVIKNVHYGIYDKIPNCGVFMLIDGTTARLIGIWSEANAENVSVPYREGYTFDCWKVTKGSGKITQTQIEATSITSNGYDYYYDCSFDGDVEITAQWTKND